MSQRPYGPPHGDAIPLSEYHQSRTELDGLPVTVAEKIAVTNTPNIFSYRSYVFARNPALIRRFIKATKADVGGVGGHVVAADAVKSVIAKFVLDNNGYRGEPIFTSLIVTHTGDDCAVTGIMAETVDMAVVDRLMWDALQEGAGKAAELGLYGPGQDLVADAFTGNLRGAGPATVALPFPVRKDNASQTVLVSFADKTEPMAFNHYATGAYMLPRFNTGLVIAASKMKRGYLFEIVDLDTKAQAIEAGAHPRDPRALDGKMEELAKGLQEKVITLRAPEDLYDIEGLTRSSRFVIARIWTRDEHGQKDQLGYICSAERLHNIKTKKGFTYGGKDDPVLLAFAQGDWPAPARSPRRGRRRPWWLATAAAATTCTSCRCRSTRRRRTGRGRSCRRSRCRATSTPAASGPSPTSSRSARPGTRYGARPPGSPSSSATPTGSSSRPRCTRTSWSTRRAGKSAGRGWSGSSRCGPR
jgi:fructose 1,6-bisphosphatase